ncbi:hypothetical protein ALC57_18492 [Trachymyrmex cornetzi]|uniref:Uncharacterized protein n=1 Tax=Trachymyrmex cornetzi TaxID=471704 RepID=A0A151IRT4_9HYME|nr:hypothetical protein ALC57_18492 [Trachymyrmex cornetzi]
MPYYNDVPYYYGGGAYANHSSLMTGIVRMPFHTSLSRFSPHLSTISESPLSHLHRFSPISVRSARRVIDTADIDVSSPRILSHNRNPSRNLRRDRPTIKIRSQALKDNPALREHNEKHEKSVGELLMEKFFIKDKKLVDNDNSQQGIRLDHQINLDRLEDSEEREAVRKRITRRFTRRRSSADLQLNSEQMQREAAYAQVQAKVLDSLVAEEQAQIENETRQSTLMFKKGTTAKELLEYPYANNIDSDMMIQEKEQAAMTRIRKAMKKTKKKRFVDKLSSTDKIDKRRSSTSSEISIDSQITENDESRPQIYKIEACNSAGDFSTFWVNTNAEKRCKSPDEKFKESIRVSIPNRFGTGNETDVISNDADEAETQVVLTVQKSYVKDLSRNSVCLTIKKPTEKFNKKLKEIEKLDVKADENQLNLTNSFVDIENNILTNNISKSLTDVDSAEPNCKIQMKNNIKDFKALKKAVYKSKNTESLARNGIPISKDDSSNNRNTNILATKSNMQEIVTEDSSFSKETETTPIQSNILAFISTNASRNDSQMENFRGILEDTFIADIKNDESQKDHLIDNITKKIFDYLEVDSTIKTPKVLAIKNSVASVESDKFISEKVTLKSLAMPHNENMIKQNIIEIESSDNVGKNNVSDTMLTTINSATRRLPKLSKINTDRNNAVEAPKLPLRETAEYQADSLKSDHDVGTVAVVLPEKKMNKTSNLAQVSSFNTSKRTNSVDAYKLSFKIDATRHNNAVKLEANETTLPKETNDKVYSSEYCDEAKLAADIKPAEDVGLTKTSRNNAKRTNENILTLKTTDSSNIETEMIITETTADAKEPELKTDSIKKINCIDVGKDSLKDLSSFKSKMPMLLENNIKENGIANLSNIGKDSGAFNIIKIEDGKSFLCNNANDETRILKKNISVDSSKLINDRSANNISKVFQQSISNDEKATGKDISVKKTSKTKPVSKITEKKSMKIDPSYNSQDESAILSRSTSTESIDFWSEIKAPDSPEMTRSKQQNRFPLRETSTSKIEENINSMNSKRKDNKRKTEIDIKMSTTTFESLSIDGFSNIVFEKEKEKEKIVSNSLRSEKTEKEKLAKVTEIERNIPTVQNIPSKKKNFSIVIDTKDISPTVKKATLKCNNFGTTSVTTSVEVTMPEINIIEAPELFKECDNRKVEEEHENPSTPTNELSFDPSLIRKISRWSNQDDLTNINDIKTPVVSEETSLVTSPSVSPLQSSKTKRAIKKKKPSTKKALLEKSEKGLKEICNNELITSVNERNMLITKFVPEKQHLVKILPKTSPKSSPKNTPLQRPLDLMKMFYTTPSALLTATPRDLSKVRRAKIKRRRHHSRTPSISSDSTESTTSSTVTTRSTDENGSTRVELNDDSEHKRMNSTRSNDSGFDGSPRILSTYFAIVCH